MKVLINFANEKYRKTQKFNSWTGKHIAKFDNIIEFSPEDIDSDFFNKNSKILSTKRGAGLWLWKPYFVNKVLNELKDGDYLFYSDSGAFFIRGISALIQSMGQDEIWLYGLPLKECQFTQREVFETMNAVDNCFKETNQFSATFLLLKVGDKSRAFVKEWLNLCCKYELIAARDTDQIDSFIAHREDQSILSILAKKYNIKMHLDPSQYGKLPEKSLSTT